MSQPPDRTAIVTARAPAAPIDTTEIRALATAAGYAVADEVTQPGGEDASTYLGSGTVETLATAVETLATAVEESDADLVVVDDGLTPAQHHALESALPAGTRLLDRHRLVLDIFEEGVGSRRARLQVELARLKYDLPRIIESADEGALNKRTEKGSPVYDVRDRIDRLERTLADLPDPTEQFRERRREQGFDLLTLAGYTNAGKSTLLHHLADDMSLADAAGSDGDGPEKDATAAVADRLFETLETTTRRATIDGRPVLATDTVGFVDELPHDLVRSFSSTLSEAAAADVVVLVADASEPSETFEQKLEVSLSVLDEQGVDDDRIITALNKVDRLEPGERAERLETAVDSAPEPIPVSVLEGTNLEGVRAAIGERLPTEASSIRMPNCDEAMALVSKAYDRAVVDDVRYADGTVTLECRGRPSVIKRLQASARSIDGYSSH